VIRYCVLLLVLSFISIPSVDAQESTPVISAIQQGNKTVLMLSGNWTSQATSAELILSSSSSIKGAAASDRWQDEQTGENEVSFKLIDGTDSSSVFVVYTNSSNPELGYRLVLDSTEYSGTINPVNNGGASLFQNWTESRENAMSAYIPRGWTADLQIIRPYDTMTGFVFFMRGPDNALAYVFYPFMPIHILPEDQICEVLGTCGGVASADVARRVSFGNAPIGVSELMTPARYFESEVLPLLQTNLDGYTVTSLDPIYALQYDSDNSPTAKFLRGLDLNYGFELQGKSIVGKSTLLISNQTTDNSGYWNGVIVGIESPQERFDEAFQEASVTLLTLRLDDKWMNEEQGVLDQNAASSNPSLYNVSSKIAEHSLRQFDSIISTAAHALVRSYGESRIAAFTDTDSGEELHLPLYESTENWYLQDGQLVGRKPGRNIMNDTSLELLWK
jgi:hypothetical protein